VLDRKSSYVLRLEKLGYQLASVTLTSHASGALWRNAVWIHPVEWAIGAGIDLGNGSGCRPHAGIGGGLSHSRFRLTAPAK
jgi:hypothetical protein